MEIEVRKVTDYELLKDAVKFVFGVDSSVSLERWYKSGDSPIYSQWFAVFCKDVPYSVCMQMRTHSNNGAFFMIESARPDTGSDRSKGSADRGAPRNMFFMANAGHLMAWSHKRLCTRAEAPTRAFMEMLKGKLSEVDQGLANQMVPLCEYRNGACDMFHSCHRNLGGKYTFSGETSDGVTVHGGLMYDQQAAPIILTNDSGCGIVMSVIKPNTLKLVRSN